MKKLTIIIGSELCRQWDETGQRIERVFRIIKHSHLRPLCFRMVGKRVLSSNTAYVVDQIAKELGTTAVSLNRKLKEKNE